MPLCDSGAFNQQIQRVDQSTPHHSQSNGQMASSNEINLVEYAYDYSGINNFALYQF